MKASISIHTLLKDTSLHLILFPHLLLSILHPTHLSSFSFSFPFPFLFLLPSLPSSFPHCTSALLVPSSSITDFLSFDNSHRTRPSQIILGHRNTCSNSRNPFQPSYPNLTCLSRARRWPSARSAREPPGARRTVGLMGAHYREGA